MYTGQYCRNRRARHFMNQRAENRIFLRRTTHDRKRPDRIAAMVDSINIHDRKIMRQTVISQMIAERTFGQNAIRIDRATDAEICIRANHRAAIPTNHPQSSAR